MLRSLNVVIAIVCAVGVSACSKSSSSSNSGSTGTGTSAASGSTASTTSSTTTTGTSATTGTSSSSTGGTTGCSAQQLNCGGTCVDSRTDPDNCGGCGVSCDGDAGLACSAGVCSSSCLTPLVVCDRACVDRGSDSANCGTCGNVCPANQGCVDGACKPALSFDAGAGSCIAGGPPIFLGIDAGALDCAANLAQVTFRWALCSCSDLALSANLQTDGFDSRFGPYSPDAGGGGGVGTDGNVQTSSTANVNGTLWAAGSQGIQTSSSITVGDELHAGGNCSFKSVSVANDGYLAGNLNVQSTSTMGGTLFQQDGGTITGPFTAASVVHEPVSIPEPCDCTNLIPISAIVAAHATNNDNAAIGLSSSALNPPPSDLRIDLPCGSYYLDAIQASTAITIVAHGNTALFIGGDIGVSKSLAILPDPASQLDVFVAGSINNSAELTLGSPNYPAQMRLYVQGDGASAISLSASANLASNIYAAAGLMHTSAPLLEYGGIIAGTYQSSASTTIHYDRAVVATGGTCSAVDAGFPSHPSDAGAQCGSCSDCGNQACINGQCTGCQSSADCCAPLTCNNGTCTVQFQ